MESSVRPSIIDGENTWQLGGTLSCSRTCKMMSHKMSVYAFKGRRKVKDLRVAPAGVQVLA